MKYTVEYYIWEKEGVKHKKAVIELQQGEKLYDHFKRLHGNSFSHIRKVCN